MQAKLAMLSDLAYKCILKMSLISVIKVVKKLAYEDAKGVLLKLEVCSDDLYKLFCQISF